MIYVGSRRCWLCYWGATGLSLVPRWTSVSRDGCRKGPNFTQRPSERDTILAVVRGIGIVKVETEANGEHIDITTIKSENHQRRLSGGSVASGGATGCFDEM